MRSPIREKRKGAGVGLDEHDWLLLNGAQPPKPFCRSTLEAAVGRRLAAPSRERRPKFMRLWFDLAYVIKVED